MARDYLTFDATAEVDIDDVIADLERMGYAVIKNGNGDQGPVAKRAYEAYTTGRITEFDLAIRDWFERELGRLVGASPWGRT